MWEARRDAVRRRGKRIDQGQVAFRLPLSPPTIFKFKIEIGGKRRNGKAGSGASGRRELSNVKKGGQTRRGGRVAGKKGSSDIQKEAHERSGKAKLQEAAKRSGGRASREGKTMKSERRQQRAQTGKIFDEKRHRRRKMRSVESESRARAGSRMAKSFTVATDELVA